MSLIYNAEHWILKLQSWFLVSQVERALNFQEQVIMLSVKSLSWIINFERWNVKLKVECYNLMLAAQVECWGLKLIFGSLSWVINSECWNVKLNVECYNLMLAAQVECWGLKLIFGGDWIP